jgi:pyruvate ferredoxin oxidoreductase gamma subunit
MEDLKVFDEKYYEIKLESVGGLGANMLGKMLGELGAIYLNLDAQSFSSYGSEKRGSPVKSYIRWSKGIININSPITDPNVLGIFYEAILRKKGSINSISDKTIIVINTDKSPKEISKMLDCQKIYTIDCQKIAMESKSRINMIMLGAIIKAIGFVDMKLAEQLIRETIGKKYPKMLDINLEGLKRGYDDVKLGEFKVSENHKSEEVKPKWGYENAPIGGVNPQIGGTIVNDLSASRDGYVPIFIKEKCINCCLCDTTCPDMVYQFRPGEYKGKKMMVNLGPDYYHCKGCLRCVDVCPSGALVKGVEKDQKLKSLRNLDLIVDHLEYETQGPSSWITSESYFERENVDGGLK